MSTYAIGDVQGCYDELRELVERIEFDAARDRLWFVGDLVNRGPKSLEVLRFVRSLKNSAVTVLGNHDLHLLAVAYGGPRAKDRLRDDDTLGAILKARDRDELLHWLKQQPLFHADSELGYAMVHAGLPPEWDLPQAKVCAGEVESVLRDDASLPELFANMYGNRPDSWSDSLRGADRIRFIVNCLTRLRVVDARGSLQMKFKGTLEQVPDGYFPWFRAPKRRSARDRIVCGHWSALDYYEGDGVVSIDAGCVWGGRLCAVRLDDRPEPTFVKSRQPRVHGD